MPRFDQITLNTGRLLLRPLGADDAPALLAIFSDPAVMRYWSTPPWDSKDKAHAEITHDLKEMANGKYLRLGIERTQDRTLIGNCTLFSIVAHCRRAEVGYALSSSAWGRGYMNEALHALLNWGFSQLGLNRVEADIDPRNKASAKILERLGFQKEGCLRERWIVDGEISDTALYGLLLSDWNARQSANNKHL